MDTCTLNYLKFPHITERYELILFKNFHIHVLLFVDMMQVITILTLSAVGLWIQFYDRLLAVFERQPPPANQPERLQPIFQIHPQRARPQRRRRQPTRYGEWLM